MVNIRLLPLLMLFILFILGFTGLGHTESISIDVNNPDPHLWDKIQEQLKARELSRQKIGYFSLGKEILELRAALESNDKGQLDDFVLMDLPKGGHLWVSQKPEMRSDDIYGILIEKTTYNQTDGYMITLYFKQESWDKFREVTTKLVKKDLAIIRGRTLLAAPRISEPLIGSATITSDFKLADIESFKKGLLPMDAKSVDAWTKKTVEWLEERSKKNPNDMQILTVLAREYYEHKPRECEKALPLFEKVILLDRTQKYALYPAHECYKSLKRYDNALTFYQKTLAVTTDKKQEMEIRMKIAEIYGLKGEKQKMIDEAEKNLVIMKEMPLPTADFIPEGPDRERYLGEMRKMKAQAIKEQEEAIERAKAELTRNQEQSLSK